MHTVHVSYYAYSYCQINVILVSSGDITFPYSLRCPGFSSRDITRFIFTSEVSAEYKPAYIYLYLIYIYLCMQVSPADTYELLTTEWGMGHHLATALVERCGGHLYDIRHTLEWLAWDKYADALRCGYFDYVQRCLDSVEGDPAATAEMARMLTELARIGFCAMRGITDPVAAKISSHDVGTIVCKGSTICGFDYASRWQSSTSCFGLVPAQQSMRLVIATKLDSRGLLKGKGRGGWFSSMLRA